MLAVRSSITPRNIKKKKIKMKEEVSLSRPIRSYETEKSYPERMITVNDVQG